MSLLVASAGCAGDPIEDLPAGTGGKADELISSVCGIEVVTFEQRGAGEVGELDTDPRSRANQAAAELNAALDCQHQIDRCFVPRYFVSEDETRVLVEIANSEIVGARQLHIDFAFAAEQRGATCTACDVEDCAGAVAACDPEILATLSSCTDVARDNDPDLTFDQALDLCVEDTNGTFHALCEESDHFDCAQDFEAFAAQLPVCRSELQSR